MKTSTQGWNRSRWTWIGAGVAIAVATTAVVLHYRNALQPQPPRILPPISLDAPPMEIIQQVREVAKRTPEEQIPQLRAEVQEQGLNRIKAEALAYVEMNEEERVAYLDRRIDEFGAMRDEAAERFREARESGNLPDFRGGPGGDGETRGPRGGRGGDGQGGGPGFGGRREPPTPGQQAERLRGVLTNTTPQERAAMQRLWEDGLNRARERGIAVPGGFGER